MQFKWNDKIHRQHEVRGERRTLKQHLPRSLQDSPKLLQDPPKTVQNGPKTPPRRSPDALKRSQGAFQTRPRRIRIAPDIPKPSNMPPRPLQTSIFEGLGCPKLRFYFDFLKLPSDSLLEASKPLSIQYGDGGMRGAFEFFRKIFRENF